jgi:2-C-methyl-D-erythritol 4-phosphate cytidylyltransferase
MIPAPLRYWAAIPAAGAGRRYGSAVPKQYLRLHGQLVIDWALLPFLDDVRCAGICVALADQDDFGARWLRQQGAKVFRAPGGHERPDSVSNALEVLSQHATDSDWVLVHDAARPCLTRTELDALLATLPELVAEREGALLAMPMADTLKRSTADASTADGSTAHVSTAHVWTGSHAAAPAASPLGQATTVVTVSREGFWRAQTPQAFRLGALRAALGDARARQRVPTDEAQAMEWYGGAAHVVRGLATNLKITAEDDLALADAVLARRVASAVTDSGES